MGLTRCGHRVYRHAAFHDLAHACPARIQRAPSLPTEGLGSETHDRLPPTRCLASADAYERYVGRWSRLVARDFLAWLAVPQGGRWLDVGCGSGALTETIIRVAAPASVLGIDPSADFLARAQAALAGERVTFERGDAEAIPVPDDAFDAVVVGLVLNFVRDPDRALAEARRVARAGGFVGAYVWDYGGEMQMMRRFWDAAVALDPGAHELDEGFRFPIARPAALAALFGRAGLVDVDTRAIDIPTRFVDFEDFWEPSLGGQAPAPAYLISLPPAGREALRDRIRATLPIAADGSINLVARAWAVRGREPG